MEFIRRAALLLTAGIIAVSCGESEDETYKDKETRSFERWISMYINTDPANPVAVELDNGGYMQLLSSNGQVPETYPQWGDYVEINYRGMLLSDWDLELEKGSMFMTRIEEDAQRMGTFTSYTHYVPQLLLNSHNSNIMGGMVEAIQLMKAGDVVRLYLPSWQAATLSGLTTGSGYGGVLSSIPENVPLIVEMELVSVVENPQTMEEQFVIDYARTQWNQTVADTVRQYIFLNIDEMTKTPDIAGVDSTVTLYYKSMLAYDDFPISTNIDSVAQRWERSKQSLTSYKPAKWADVSSDGAMALQALYEVFGSEEITYGCDFEFITTSQFAYGSAGQTPGSTATEVLPYQPVKYWVRLEPYEDDED